MSETIVLDNGLRILGEVNKNHASVALGFFVRTGSRDEIGPESGVSHFLEHMMFKGTKKRSALDITFELGNIGAQANAFTSEENTVYYAVILPEYFDRAFDLLSDMLRPALDPAEFTTEKQVILEEIALYQDRPHFYLFEKSSREFFGEHPAGNSVLGSTESITALTAEQMRAYFDRRYVASQITLVAAGNFSWDKLCSQAKTLCGNWPKGSLERTYPKFNYKQITREYRRKNLQQAHVLLSMPSCSAQESERYPLSLLGTMLGDVSGSRLYWELIEKGLADSASADLDERDQTGSFSFYASAEPAKIDQVAKILENVGNAVLDFSDQDLQRAKNKVATRIALDGELPMGRFMRLGMEWVYRKETTALSDTIEKIKSVTRADIEKALSRFPIGNWSEFRLLPESA